MTQVKTFVNSQQWRSPAQGQVTRHSDTGGRQSPGPYRVPATLFGRCGHWEDSHAPVDTPTSMYIQAALTALNRLQ